MMPAFHLFFTLPAHACRVSFACFLMKHNAHLFALYRTVSESEMENRKKYASGKWITNLAIVLTVLGGLIALVIGIGILSAPDVSPFTN